MNTRPLLPHNLSCTSGTTFLAPLLASSCSPSMHYLPPPPIYSSPLLALSPPLLWLLPSPLPPSLTEVGMSCTSRAHGRVNPYMSSPCHIELTVTEKDSGVKAEQVSA